MHKKVYYIICFLLLSFAIKAQQMPLYSMYMLNGFTFNPAIAGYNGLTTLNLTSRQQWLGMENAPRSVSFSLQSRLLMRSYSIKRDIRKGNRIVKARNGRIGLGLNIYNDRNGYYNQSGGNFSYAYHVPFQNAQLSFGLAASITQYKIDTEGISFRDSKDYDNFSDIGKPIYVPDANAGIFYDNFNFYSGFSVANILESEVKYGNPNMQSYRLKRHYYFVAGYRIIESKKFTYEPAILIKTTETLTPQIDLSLKAEYIESYWAGVSYRSLNSFIVFIGITKYNFSAGYAFDYDFNAFQRFSYGSHELNLALKFGDSAKRYRWVRRF